VRTCRNLLVTGDDSIIGLDIIQYVFDEVGFTRRITNTDKRTYAGNTESLDYFAAESMLDRLICGII